MKYEFPYEPYLIGRRTEFPRFSRFFDFVGNNRVSFLYELNIRNFTFSMLPWTYVGHIPHFNIDKWGTKRLTFDFSLKYWNDFIKQMRAKYPNQEIIDEYISGELECGRKTCTDEEEERERVEKGKLSPYKDKWIV